MSERPRGGTRFDGPRTKREFRMPDRRAYGHSFRRVAGRDFFLRECGSTCTKRGYTRRDGNCWRAVRKTNVEYDLPAGADVDAGDIVFPVSGGFTKRSRNGFLPEDPRIEILEEPADRCGCGGAGCSTGRRALFPSPLRLRIPFSFADAWNVEILATDVGKPGAEKQRKRGSIRGGGLSGVNEKAARCSLPRRSKNKFHVKTAA